jgi:hypothetical protein
LLAEKYQQNNNLLAALDKLWGNGINMIDEEFLWKAFQGMNKGKVNMEETITDFAISNLVNVFTSQTQVLFELERQRSKGCKDRELERRGSENGQLISTKQNNSKIRKINKLSKGGL